MAAGDKEQLQLTMIAQATSVDPVTGQLIVEVDNYVWDAGGLAWVKMTQPGGGGGGAATIADGADVTQGAIADAAVGDASGTVNAHLRQVAKLLAAALPLPTGAATEATLAARTKPSDQQHVIVDTMTPALALDATVNGLLKPASTLAAVTAVTAITNALPAGTNRLGSARLVDSADADLSAAKGVQTTRSVGVTDQKDAGRVVIMWTAEFSPAAVAEALLTVTESRDGAAVTTFTSKVVTNGKRLRLTSWGMAVENTLGVNPKRAKLRLKFNTAGAVVVGSPLQANLVASVATAVNTVGQEAFQEFPDGIEYLGDGTKQIGFTLEFPDWVTAAQTGKVYITIFGFEY